MRSSHSRTKKSLQLTSALPPNVHSSIRASQQKLVRTHTNQNRDRWISKEGDELQATAFR